MGWVTLGIVTPNLNWQTFGISSVDGSLFRVRSTWSKPPYYGLSAYLAQFFYNQDTTDRLIKIWPQREDRLIRLETPPELRADGIIVKDIGIKLKSPFRHGAWTHDWAVELQEYFPDRIPISQDAELILQQQQEIEAEIAALTEAIQNQPPPNVTVSPQDPEEPFIPGQGQL